jgi:hypothetical protein
MHKAAPCIADLPVKVYKQVPSPGGQLHRAADMDLVAKVRRQGRSALIFPGHGEYYPLEQAE